MCIRDRPGKTTLIDERNKTVMNSDQYYEYFRKSQQGVKQYILKNRSSILNKSDENAQKMLNDKTKDIHESVRNMMRNEYRRNKKTQ